MKVLQSLFVALFLQVSFISPAQDLTPPIQNYTSVAYEAARQNWDIAIDEKGIVYAANHKGLLVFDGQRWELLPLKNGAIIRSVYPHNGRIYIGSYQEFGYWTRNNTGKYCYTSLIPLLGEYEMQSEEFWQILSHKNDVYFRSFGAIYKYDGEKIEVLKNIVTNEMTIYKDRLLVAVGQQGLYFLDENGEMEPLPGQEILKGKTIREVIVVDQDELLIGTRNVLFQYGEYGCRLYPNGELNDLLNRFELNHLLRFSENELVLGTVKSGIIHFNETTGKMVLYNHNGGLQNNTILGMSQREGELWLALDNGIDALSLNYPIQFYRDESGELGSVYDLSFYKDSVFLASNTGVYRLVGDDFLMVEGAEGHSWNLETLDSELYSNHNSGTYKIIDGEFSPVTERTGSFQIHKLSGNKYLIGTYNGIEIYDEGTQEVKVLEDARFPIRQIIFEDSNTLWATHAYEGVFRIEMTESQDSILSVISYNPEKEESYRADIFEINGQILVYSNNLWYKYNSFKDELEIFPELKEFAKHRFLLHEDSYYWFLNESNYSIKVTDLKKEQVVISSGMLERRLVNGNERLVRKNDSTYYITLQDGFARINLPRLLEFRGVEPVNGPILQGVLDKEQRYHLGEKAEIPFNLGREITVLAGLPVTGKDFLYYQLKGPDELTGRVENGSIQFRNLAPGDYNLKLLGMNPQGIASSSPVSFDFEILPPWYLSRTMKGLYLLILLSIAILIYKINQLKLKKHRRVLEEKYEKEHREHLHSLEKKNLLEEINLKKKELANSTLVAAKKNEVLMEIQGELSKDQGQDDYRRKNIMKRINKELNNRDDWKIFETSFNEVHEDFFKELLDRYPELSNKDLKLCSYLKMNLSSKEIAPLLGISIRGVEVQRYRLRKKMGLDSKANLNNFFIANF